MTRTVFANKRNFSHKGSGDQSMGSAPDVCKTPVGNSTPPIPYTVVSIAGDLDQCTKSVFIDGHPTAIASSIHKKCSGDEPGKAKGLGSGTTGDITQFVSYSYDVRCEGEGAVRHMDLTQMNKGNTVGMIHGATASSDDNDQEQEEKSEPRLKNIVLRLNISADQGVQCDDKYRLSVSDGSYQCTKTVSADMIKGDSYIDLLYEELDTEKKYTLEHIDSHTGETYIYFNDISFLSLSLLSTTARRSVE